MTNILDTVESDSIADGFDRDVPLYSRETVERLLSDYEEVLAGHRLLVRVLDVLMHGEEGAAQQASLCDLVAMFPAWKDAHSKQVLLEAAGLIEIECGAISAGIELRRMAEGEK
jgi:hypothetical protein